MTSAPSACTIFVRRLLCAVALICTALGAARPALAQWQDPPQYVPKGYVEDGDPVRNPLPPKDSPSLYTDNGKGSSASSCELCDARLSRFTGDPVSLHNGASSYRTTDLFIPGRGIHFELTRRYYSKNASIAGPLGFGWDLSYSVKLIKPNTDEIRIENGNGRIDRYWRISSSSNPDVWYSSGIYNRLYLDGGQYVVRNRHGERMRFTHVSGSNTWLMTSIEDPNGNTLTIQWDTSTERIVSVVDTLGRLISFYYDSGNRLERVEDYAGREVLYSYSAEGDLIAVRSPTISSTSGFNDFSSGRTESYTYWTEVPPQPPGVLQHFLKSVVRPVDQSAGTPYLQFEYYTVTTTGAYAGWVKEQILGGSTGGYAAGGTIAYSYTPLNPQSPFSSDLTLSRLRTSVIDRRGNQADVYFNERGNAIQVDEYSGTTSIVATTAFEYNADGELVTIVYPEGNIEERDYYDGAGHPDLVERFVQGNLKQITRYPDSARGSADVSGSPSSHVVKFWWDPVYNSLFRTRDELGRETTYSLDYMESDATTMSALVAAELNITTTQASLLLSPAGGPSYLSNQDLNGDGTTNQLRGNLVVVRNPDAALASAISSRGQQAEEGGTTPAVQESITTYVYNAYGQLIASTDTEQNNTLYYYYSERKPYDDSIDTGNSAANTTTGGYLQRIVRDVALPYTVGATRLDAQLSSLGARSLSIDSGRDSNQNPAAIQAKTDYVYNEHGDVIKIVDPRGVHTDFGVNELGEVWQVIRAASVIDVASRLGGYDPSTAESLTGQAYSYSKRIKYDANGNVVHTRVFNSGNNADQGNITNWLETDAERDILGNVRKVKREAGLAGETAVWVFDLDPNQRLLEVTLPETNKVRYGYDARGLLTSVTRGYGASGEESSTAFGYDGNRNRTSITDGMGNVTSLVYDGYDRLKQIAAPTSIGSETSFYYDAASNLRETVESGEYPGATGILGLRKIEREYDARDRLVMVHTSTPTASLPPSGPIPALVDGALSGSDGRVSARYDYDRLSRLTFRFEDDEQAYQVKYDGAGRAIASIDPIGNTVAGAYDDNGNLVRVTEAEVYPSTSAVSSRDYYTYRGYDSLNRLISLTEQNGTDPDGVTRRFEYDSRDNLVSASDAKGTGTTTLFGLTVNDAGNVTTYRHDSLDRLIETVKDLNVGGVSGTLDTSNTYNTDGKITLTQKWDKNSRLTEQTDDRLQPTKYEYDASDRMTLQRFADLTSGASLAYTYDAASNLTGMVDRRNDTFAFSYDAANRLEAIDVSLPSPSVAVGTTHLAFGYDGLNRRVYERDSVDGTLDSNDWIVERKYDALDRIREETQGGRTITNAWREESERTALTYSSSASPLTIDYGHDALDRLSSISIGGTGLVAYNYAGPNRLFDRTITISTSKSLMERRHSGPLGSYNDANYWDGLRRPERMDTVNRVGVIQSSFEHGFDNNHNRTYELRTFGTPATTMADRYSYDSANRLVQFQRDIPDFGDPVEDPAGVSDWKLDGAQNWRHATIDGKVVSSVATVNAYIKWIVGGVTETPSYDLDGNMTSPHSGASSTTKVTYEYDAFNRLRTITRDGKTIAHDYDASGRRVRTASSGITNAPGHVEYVYDGWDVIEEFDASNVLMRRFVLGKDMDEPIRMETFSFWNNQGTYYYQRATLGNVVALTNSNGATVERYTYDAYGIPTFQDATGATKVGVTESDYDNPYLFNARRYEPWLRPLYEFRHRVYDPEFGRFIQRDPIGVWADSASLGNPYTYGGSSPINLFDLLGLRAGDTYPSRDMAAFAGLQEAMQKASQNGGREHGGYIVVVRGENGEVKGYTYTEPETSPNSDPTIVWQRRRTEKKGTHTKTESISINVDGTGGTYEVRGQYHTHPYTAGPSTADVPRSDFPEYIGEESDDPNDDSGTVIKVTTGSSPIRDEDRPRPGEKAKNAPADSYTSTTIPGTVRTFPGAPIQFDPTIKGYEKYQEERLERELRKSWENCEQRVW